MCVNRHACHIRPDGKILHRDLKPGTTHLHKYVHTRESKATSLQPTFLICNVVFCFQGNVFLDGQHCVKLGDFGLARMMNKDSFYAK